MADSISVAITNSSSFRWLSVPVRPQYPCPYMSQLLFEGHRQPSLGYQKKPIAQFSMNAAEKSANSMQIRVRKFLFLSALATAARRWWEVICEKPQHLAPLATSCRCVGLGKQDTDMLVKLELPVVQSRRQGLSTHPHTSRLT